MILCKKICAIFLKKNYSIPLNVHRKKNNRMSSCRVRWYFQHWLCFLLNSKIKSWTTKKNMQLKFLAPIYCYSNNFKIQDIIQLISNTSSICHINTTFLFDFLTYSYWQIDVCILFSPDNSFISTTDPTHLHNRLDTTQSV